MWEAEGLQGLGSKSLGVGLPILSLRGSQLAMEGFLVQDF